MGYRIMIVEDDGVIASEIQKSLTQWGFEVHCAQDFSRVAEEFDALLPHLVLMDISLPFFNGYYWCAELRKRSKVPVIFISSRTDNMDVVMAVNMGGDDYITKPLSMDVLVAKIQAMLRRAYDYECAAPPKTLRGAELSEGECCLKKDGKRIELTRNGMKILQTLLEHKGEIVSREAIMLKLWDSDEFIDDNTLTVNVNRLRKTLEQEGLGGCIVTHKKQGYSIHE